MSSSEAAIIAKPKLRGVFHQWALVLFFFLLLPILSQSVDGENFWPLFFYFISICGMFAVSALYHRPTWTPSRRALLKRLDHSAIYFSILGTAAPICIIGMKGDQGSSLFHVVTVICLIGLIKAIFFTRTRKWITAMLPIAMAVFIFPYIPQLQASLGVTSLYILILGGFFNGVGGLVYGFKTPNPWPKIFGYHEILHVMSVIGALCNYVVIMRLV